MITTQSLLILYTTHADNSEEIAKAVAAAARKRGYEPTTTSMADYRFELHVLEGRILLIASSTGEGNPPPDAEEFYDWIKTRTEPLLKVRYSVYALGCDCHEDLSGFGKALDAEFERLGATRIAERSDNDKGDDAGLEKWLEEAFAGFADTRELAAAG